VRIDLLGNFYKTTLCNIPEDSTYHSDCCEKLVSNSNTGAVELHLLGCNTTHGKEVKFLMCSEQSAPYNGQFSPRAGLDVTERGKTCCP
jgi:hypothetical protein